MTVDMCDQKRWSVKASDFASNTHNPIRAIVESLHLEPNPTKQMIALSIGDPTIFGNLAPPKGAIDAIKRSLDCGKCNGYAPGAGSNRARQAIAEYSSTDKVKVNWKDVIICSGCSSAIDLSITVLANHGDNILIPRPGFSIYRTLSEGLGVRVKYYNLQPEKQWEIDLKHLESQIDANSKAIVINNPSNPCGSVYSKRHLQEILHLASRYCLPIIADEIYENLVFPGENFISLASLSRDVPILTCSGLTKRFLCPGWRVGWVIIHDRNGIFKDVRNGLIKLSQRTLGSNTIVQEALPEILKTTPSHFFNDVINVLQRNALMAYRMLSEIPGLNPIMPQGAMYIMIGIEMAVFPDIKDDIGFVEQMVTEESVFCLPGKCFDYPNFIRIIITPPEEMLREALERIAKFCERHYNAQLMKTSDNITATLREAGAHESPELENAGRNLS